VLGRVTRDGFDPTGATIVDLVRPLRVCNPATLGGGLGDPAVVLEAYRMRRSRLAARRPPTRGALVDAATEFGALRLAVKAAGDLLLPSTLTIGGAGAPPSDAANGLPFTCYAAKAVRTADGPRFAPVRRTVTDRFGPRVLDIRRPTRLCKPASVDDDPGNGPERPGTLVCYAVRLATTEPRQEAFGRTLIATANRIAGEPLALTRPAELCLASLDAGRPEPFTIPPPPVLESVRVGPATRAVPPGESVHFTAIGVFSDGTTKNYTRRVKWKSSDPTIATVGTTSGTWGLATGLAPGLVMISVTDPLTGIGSGDSGANATFNVIGELEAIRLAPTTARIRAGQDVQLNAVGIYTGGATQSITQQLLYETSDPAVAVAPNADGSRSRIDAVAPGTVAVSAVDPVTGIHSSASGGGATVTVLDHPIRLTLAPTTAARRVGESIAYTATGHFPDGTTKNLTQQVLYASSKPVVAAAPNTPGDRSRVDALRAGTTKISVVDPVTGLASPAATLTVNP
jgi:hypothetical protein